MACEKVPGGQPVQLLWPAFENLPGLQLPEHAAVVRPEDSAKFQEVVNMFPVLLCMPPETK